MFKLKNREFTFDVDASALSCGFNGALYFVGKCINFFHQTVQILNIRCHTLHTNHTAHTP